MEYAVGSPANSMAVAHYSLVELADRIRLAIAEELKVASAGLPFRVTDIHKQGGILTMELEPQDLRCSLDETMEDGRLGWKGETAGSADIIAVLPDTSYINAVMTSGRPPGKGEIVFINPARYLEPLANLWDRPDVSEAATRWYFELNENVHLPSLVPDHHAFKRCVPHSEPHSNWLAGRPAISGVRRAQVRRPLCSGGLGCCSREHVAESKTGRT